MTPIMMLSRTSPLPSRRRGLLRRRRLLGLSTALFASLLLWWSIAYVAVRAWQQFAVSG
jgi:hypothetical protein